MHDHRNPHCGMITLPLRDDVTDAVGDGHGHDDNGDDTKMMDHVHVAIDDQIMIDHCKIHTAHRS